MITGYRAGMKRAKARLRKDKVPIKVATFNINNINRRLPNLLGWLKSTSPDIVCLQELKTDQEHFPQDAIAEAGYGAIWRGQRTWNGVAILAKDTEPIQTADRLPGDLTDDQSRYIEAAVEGLIVRRQII